MSADNTGVQCSWSCTVVFNKGGSQVIVQMLVQTGPHQDNSPRTRHIRAVDELASSYSESTQAADPVPLLC